jgi:hypothetical protein
MEPGPDPTPSAPTATPDNDPPVAVRRRRKRNRFWALFDSFGSPQVLALGEEGAHFGGEPVRCFDGTDMANARQDGES